MSKESLQKAVELMDGQVALADAIVAYLPGCKVRQGHIWKWLNLSKKEVPPAEYVIAISQAVDWKVTPHQLRPDLYPNSTDAMPKIEEAA